MKSWKSLSLKNVIIQSKIKINEDCQINLSCHPNFDSKFNEMLYIITKSITSCQEKNEATTPIISALETNSGH